MVLREGPPAGSVGRGRRVRMARRPRRAIVERMTEPLLVYGPRSTTYDFGPRHPLTPRRFGPGISLIEALGGVPNLAPEPATDAELEWIHEPPYVETVRAFSQEPTLPPRMGLGPGDTPPFPGLHDASAAVAGGSLRAMEAILRGEVEHAFHPGGGLHHAMPARGSGFCVYNDPALAIARARRDGLRVLYVDLDVHHGDGVQAIHWSDPDVLTLSIHETGQALFPGTGFPAELGGDAARGSKVNVPLEPGTGEAGWLPALELVLLPLAEAFRPDVVVSQHGSDSHAFDPLAHLRVTTTAMGAAARLVDEIAHRWAGGRWLATGGGGYDAYRVVPRAWSLVWLAQAHRPAPPVIPGEWRDRWSGEAARYGQAPLPETFDDPPNAGLSSGPFERRADERATEIARQVLEVVLVARQEQART
jgi:acetoin utilization protein AcuC